MTNIDLRQSGGSRGYQENIFEDWMQGAVQSATADGGTVCETPWMRVRRSEQELFRQCKVRTAVVVESRARFGFGKGVGFSKRAQGKPRPRVDSGERLICLPGGQWAIKLGCMY